MARDHKAGRRTEPRASRVGQLLRCRLIIPSLSRARQLHSGAVAPVAAVQTQGQTTPRRDLSTPASLRVLRARTSDPAWAWPPAGGPAGAFSGAPEGGAPALRSWVRGWEWAPQAALT